MTEIRAVHADITTVEVDAVVNAANSGLAGGAGVDGAIHARGGPAILAECREIVARSGRLATGEAVATTGGLLPAKVVVHTVGPVWSGVDPAGQDEQLASCYRSSLEVAVARGCATVAFPCISTGLYAFPKDRAAGVAVAAVRTWVDENPADLDAVTFVCFSIEDLGHYRQRGIDA